MFQVRVDQNTQTDITMINIDSTVESTLAKLHVPKDFSLNSPSSSFTLSPGTAPYSPSDSIIQDPFMGALDSDHSIIDLTTESSIISVSSTHTLPSDLVGVEPLDTDLNLDDVDMLLSDTGLSSADCKQM